MSKRQACVFGYFKNEDELVHLWCEHYAKHFEKQDIYAYDNSSTDETLQCLETECINIEQIADEFLTINEYCKSVKARFAKLLESYDCVLFAEADDLNESPHGLRTYIEKFLSSEHMYKHHTCYEPVHQIRSEQPIVLNEPLLRQRSLWIRHPKFDSALLVKQTVNWQRGWHYIGDKQNPDLDLVYVHLKWIDFDMMNRRNTKRIETNTSTDFERSIGDVLRSTFETVATNPRVLFGEATVHQITDEFKDLI